MDQAVVVVGRLNAAVALTPRADTIKLPFKKWTDTLKLLFKIWADTLKLLFKMWADTLKLFFKTWAYTLKLLFKIWADSVKHFLNRPFPEIQVLYQILLTTGFEPRTFSIDSNCSAN